MGRLAAYDPEAVGYFVEESLDSSDVAAARSEAISYAAFRVMEARYIDSIGAEDTITEIVASHGNAVLLGRHRDDAGR